MKKTLTMLAAVAAMITLAPAQAAPQIDQGASPQADQVDHHRAKHVRGGHGGGTSGGNTNGGGRR